MCQINKILNQYCTIITIRNNYSKKLFVKFESNQVKLNFKRCNANFNKM